MPVEPADVFNLLREARCDTLDAFQQQLLAARYGAGATAEEVAEAWKYSPQAIYQALHTVGDIVLGRTGLPTDAAIMTRWFDMHLEDMPVARDVIARRVVFTAPPPPHQRRRAG